MSKFKNMLMWLPAIIIMCMIFVFSAESADKSTDTSGGVCRIIAVKTVKNFEQLPQIRQANIIENMQHAVRKTAHFAVYAMLGMAFLLPLWQSISKEKNAAIFSVLLSAIYAAFDEFHQSFIPNRSPQISDVLLDTAGAFCGVLFVCAIIYIVRRCKKGKKNV